MNHEEIPSYILEQIKGRADIVYNEKEEQCEEEEFMEEEDWEEEDYDEEFDDVECEEYE